MNIFLHTVKCVKKKHYNTDSSHEINPNVKCSVVIDSNRCIAAYSTSLSPLYYHINNTLGYVNLLRAICVVYFLFDFHTVYAQYCNKLYSFTINLYEFPQNKKLQKQTSKTKFLKAFVA